MTRLPRNHNKRRASRSPSPPSLPRWDSLPARADGHATPDPSPPSRFRHSPPKTKTKSWARSKRKPKHFFNALLRAFRRRRPNANGTSSSDALAELLPVLSGDDGGWDAEYEDEGAYEDDASAGENRVAAAMGAGLGAEVTPPRTPTTPRTDTGGSSGGAPLSPVLTNSPSSTHSAGASVRKRRRARLMSRMKLVQVLGADASKAVARRMGDGDV